MPYRKVSYAEQVWYILRYKFMEVMHNCFVYIMHEDRPLGVPTHRYMATCYEGYDDFGFDTNYLKKAFYDSLEGAQ